MIEIIKEHVNPHRRLGRHVEHDHKSRAFENPMMGGRLQSVDWTRHCPAFDQGNLGSCTGNAMAGLLMTEPFYTPGRELTEKEAVDLYCLATMLDNINGSYPPEDTGSSGLAVMKAAKKMGFISGYHHVFSFQGAISALAQGPVICGINWSSGFDAPIGDQAVLEESGSDRGGHEIVFTQIDFENSFVGGWNSWSANWGHSGRFRMSFDTWRSRLKKRGDCTVALK